MTRSRIPSAAHRHGVVAVLAVTAVLASACASAARVSPATSPALPTSQMRDAEYPRRLVLALDGVDYRDVVEARADGLFASFRAPSRLVSTFPSISDIAWHEIFGVLPPRGYQRIHYSNALDVTSGVPIDAIRPIEFEDRMDMAFGGKFHHLGAYLSSSIVANREIDQVVRQVLKPATRPTVYVYNVGPDALQHTRGNVREYLRHVDRRLGELQREYVARTGRPLEIVVLSDHGHNRGLDAKFLPVADALKARGFRLERQVRAPNDVAFSVDGVTTGFGVFCHRDSVQQVAALLASMDGVDVVTTVESPGRFLVRSGTAVARIEVVNSRDGSRYRYLAGLGDPLGYLPSIDSLRTAGALDSAGFATDATWIRATAGARYPAAMVRIPRGHTSVTLNPAPILVSLSDGYRVGLGMVSVANRLRPLGGTHGGLSASNALGVVMTNFTATHDDATYRVREQFGGFDDLRDPFRAKSGARIATVAMLSGDRFNALRDSVARAPLDPATTGVEIWIRDAERRWPGARLAFELEVRYRDERSGKEAPIVRSRTPAAAWYSGATTRDVPARRFFAPFSALALGPLAPNATYALHVRLLQLTPDPERATARRSTTLVAIPIRTDRHGVVQAY